MGCFNKYDPVDCGCACQARFVVGCGGAPVSGATVTVRTTPDGAPVATGTTDAQGLVALDIGAAGPYRVTVAADGTAGFDQTMTLACGATHPIDVCCAATFCVTGATGFPTAGAIVTAAPSAGGAGTSGTTDSTGCVTLELGGAGPYEVTVTAANFEPFDGTIVVTCGGTFTIVLCVAGSRITVHVTGCDVAQPGATVTFAGRTQTTDSSGHAYFPVPAPGTYPYSVSQTRYQTLSGNYTVQYLCQPGTINASLNPAAGYYCACNDATRYLPRPATLHGNDALYGAYTLTYDAGYDFWIGSLVVPWVNQCGCNLMATSRAPTLWYTWGGLTGCAPAVYGSLDGYFCPIEGQSYDNSFWINQSNVSTVLAPGTLLDVTTTSTGCVCNNRIPGVQPGSCLNVPGVVLLYGPAPIVLHVTE